MVRVSAWKGAACSPWGAQAMPTFWWKMVPLRPEHVFVFVVKVDVEGYDVVAIEGMRRLFRQFSFPGGIPSHVAAETPGSIHEGGELGYALSHAYGAVFDNPDLIVACVVGDGEV